jgi:hypothetical protein
MHPFHGLDVWFFIPVFGWIHSSHCMVIHQFILASIRVSTLPVWFVAWDGG